MESLGKGNAAEVASTGVCREADGNEGVGSSVEFLMVVGVVVVLCSLELIAGEVCSFAIGAMAGFLVTGCEVGAGLGFGAGGVAIGAMVRFRVTG